MPGKHDTLLAPTPPVSPGGVLTFTFLPIPKSYIAGSYPHPIKEAKDANPHEARDIVLSRTVPPSLLDCIEQSKGKERPSIKPGQTRCFTLKPGCFLMHITCWRPNPPEKDEDDPFDKCRESLWLVYSWTDRAGHTWPHLKYPTHSPNIHLTFERKAQHLDRSAIGGGHPSHLAFGETSETFFIRMSDGARNWHYRWHGLPQDCDDALQGSTVASAIPRPKPKPPKAKVARPMENGDGLELANGSEDDEVEDNCTFGQNHWTLGRLRAVTLGQGGGWIVYREEQYQALWGGRNLPEGLVKGLEYGKEHKLIINQAVLNPHHAGEYVLAYNDGTVYYRFHQDFEADFERIAKQWCGNKVTYKPKPYEPLFTDADYPNRLPAQFYELGHLPPQDHRQKARSQYHHSRTSTGTTTASQRPTPTHGRTPSGGPDPYEPIPNVAQQLPPTTARSSPPGPIDPLIPPTTARAPPAPLDPLPNTVTTQSPTTQAPVHVHITNPPPPPQEPQRMEQLEKQLQQLQEQIAQVLRMKTQEAAPIEDERVELPPAQPAASVRRHTTGRVETEREEGSSGTLKKGAGKEGKFGLRNPFYHRKGGT